MLTSMLHLLCVSFLMEQVGWCSEVNVALNRPAVQSNTFNSNVASRAVDGNPNRDADAGSCAHGGDTTGQPNWWMVDLGQPMQIKYVIATNRDGAEDRLDYFMVGVTNFSSTEAAPVRGGYPLCGQYPGQAPASARLTLQCTPNIESGRYVIVQQPINGAGYLTLCEFEVYVGNRTRRENVFNRQKNFRLMTFNVTMTLRQHSSMECVVLCRKTQGCQSVNVLEWERRCELNFLPHGASPFDLINANDWSWWFPAYDFE